MWCIGYTRWGNTGCELSITVEHLRINPCMKSDWDTLSWTNGKNICNPLNIQREGAVNTLTNRIQVLSQLSTSTWAGQLIGFYRQHRLWLIFSRVRKGHDATNWETLCVWDNVLLKPNMLVRDKLYKFCLYSVVWIISLQKFELR